MFKSAFCFPSLFCLLSLSCASDPRSAQDAGPQTPPKTACSEFDAPAYRIESFPDIYVGNILGGESDHSVAEGVCTDERRYSKQGGEDEVIQIDGLVSGTQYGIVLSSDDDLSFYLVNQCTGNDVAEGECELFSDQVQTDSKESAEFTAGDKSTLYVVIDSSSAENSRATGNYSLKVVEAQCTIDAECSGSTPFCFDFTCVECTNSFDCDSTAAPACDFDRNACVSGWDECTGDDPSPLESADDGPLGAALLRDAAPGRPTIVTQNICSAPFTEVDFFAIDLPAGAKRVFSIDWAGSADLDLVLLRENGDLVDASFRDKPEAIEVDSLPAGKYYLVVQKFEATGMEFRIALPYTVTVSIPECESSFDCPSSALPVCGATRLCSASSSECSGDDDAEQNDGPATATAISSGTILNAAVCNAPVTEVDFYKIDVASGQDLEVSVAFADTNAADIDLQIFNASGQLQGVTLWKNPETVNLSYLPAGTYFISVSYFSTATVTAAHPYTLSATLSDNVCASDQDCDDVFGTQLFRARCDQPSGECRAILGNGALPKGGACDSDDDCASGLCSVMLFQESAANSVCTVQCNADTDCNNAFGGGFRCTVPFQTNFCHPSCTSGSLECGVNQSSPNIDGNEPWDYLICNAGACELDN